MGIGIFLIRRTVAEIILHFIPVKINTVPLYAVVFIAVSFSILFLLFFAVRRVIRQDWISVSYMLMPVPLLSVWICFIDKQADFSGWDSVHLFALDRVMAICFIVTAAASIFLIPALFYKFSFHNISMDREWLKNSVKDSMHLRWRT
ncbi:MAG: hypothetical protein DRP57_04240 [Spirochaetes bacterium]|nr:MAG: hypothetical protein DRP57_04240 [Spirochaetota bacterium]